MGKASKWIKNFLTGKKETEKKKNNVNHHQSNSSTTTTATTENPTTPIAILQTTPKEKRRWSFRRSSATAPGQKDTNSSETMVTVPPLESENDQKKHALAVAAATAAAADAAAVAVKAAAAVIQLTAVASGRATAIEESAAIKIQSVFRGYLARKALNALKGLVKLQALVRGHLVRKQATATLRCMQALVTVQARARAQRIQMAQQDAIFNNPQKQFNHRNSTQENMFWNPNQDFDIGMKENIKIVEVDAGESKGSTKSRRNSYSNNGQTEKMEQWDSTPRSAFSKQDLSPAPSAITDQLTPKACSGHFEEYSSFGTAQSSPQQYYTAISKPDPARVAISYARSEYGGGGEGDSIYHEYPFYPNYMANTESSKAKVRSHSAPKQRPVESIERQPSTTRRRPSIEGRNVPRAVRMQRSSSHVGSAAQNYQYPWSIKLDRSNISIKDSECGSSSTVLTTNTNYCRSLVGFDVQGSRY